MDETNETAVRDNTDEKNERTPEQRQRTEWRKTKRKTSDRKEAQKEVERLLYLNLLAYTRDDLSDKVVAGGQREVFETYRMLHWKGKNANMAALMDKRMSVMNPDAAKTAEYIEAKMTKW